MDVTTLGKLLANQSRDELLEIIASLSACSDDAEEWLLDYCEEHGEAGNGEMIAQKQVEHTWKIAEGIIDAANDYGGTCEDEEDDVSTALFTIEDLIKKHSLDWDYRRSLIDRMLKQFNRGNSGFEDVLIDTCVACCQTDEEYLYLARRLRSSGDEYYQKFAANLFLKHGDEKSFVEIMSRNLEYGRDYIDLAEYYKGKNQIDKAIRLLETAVEKVDSRLDEVYERLFKAYRKNRQEEKLIQLYKMAQKKKRDLDTMTRLMVEYYANDDEQRKQYLLMMPELCRNTETKKWFDACKADLTPEDFSAASDRLYGLLKKKAPVDYLQLRIDEGHLDEVLHYLQVHPAGSGHYDSPDHGHRLSRQLADQYPAEVVGMYWKECEDLCSLTNKKFYPAAVTMLKEIKGICTENHMGAAWHTAFDAFLDRQGRKRCLMQLIAEEKSLT